MSEWTPERIARLRQEIAKHVLSTPCIQSISMSFAPTASRELPLALDEIQRLQSELANQWKPVSEPPERNRYYVLWDEMGGWQKARWAGRWLDDGGDPVLFQNMMTHYREVIGPSREGE